MLRKPILYQPEGIVSKFVLRLPDRYNLVLDGLVKAGVAKSKNELIVVVIATFLSDLRKKAESQLLPVAVISN
mgnify:CR=1